jgi:hypothetical protein
MGQSRLHRKIGIMKFDVFAHQGNLHVLDRLLMVRSQLIQGWRSASGALIPKVIQNEVIDMLGVQIER